MPHHFVPALLCNIFLLLPVTLSAQGAETGSIRGRILDRATKAALPAVNIIVQQTTGGVSTGTDGRFVIHRLPVGNYTLKVSCLGYKTVLITDVTVSSGHDAQVAVELEEEPLSVGDGITITGSAFYAPKEMATSYYGINYEEIRRQPGAFGDINRMIQTMPGVISTRDQRNDLVVRGGSPGENLTMVDNIVVPNISHFGTQGASGGPVNMLSAEFISGATFSAGGFPAIYGDRLSSVLNISLREGNRDGLAGTFDLGWAGAGFILEGPLSSRGSWMAAARTSFLDLIHKSLGLTAVPHYTNYQAKVNVDAAPEHRLWLVALGGVDDIHFNPSLLKDDEPEVRDISSGGWRAITGVNWRWLWGTQGYGTLSVSDVLDVYSQTVHEPRLPGNPLTFSNDSREGETRIAYDAVFHTAVADIFTGMHQTFLRASYDIITPIGDQNQFSPDTTRIARPPIEERIGSSRSAAYIHASVTPFTALDISAGARLDRYASTKQVLVSPRVSAKYALLPTLTVSASWGVFRQEPALLFLNSNPANSALEPMRAEHFIGGLAFYPAPDLMLSIEAYRKVYAKYPVSVEFPSFSLANNGEAFTVMGSLIPLTSLGTGHSRGVELFVQKKLTASLYAQISYTYSQTRHRALDGIERPGSFDNPHVFYTVGGYRLNAMWEFSGKFSFASGRPRTPFLQPQSSEQNRWIVDLAHINSARMPDYTRLDLRVDNSHHFSGWNLVWYFELQNILARKNVFTYEWNAKTRNEQAIYQTGLFAIGGVKVEF